MCAKHLKFITTTLFMILHPQTITSYPKRRGSLVVIILTVMMTLWTAVAHFLKGSKVPISLLRDLFSLPPLDQVCKCRRGLCFKIIGPSALGHEVINHPMYIMVNLIGFHSCECVVYSGFPTEKLFGLHTPPNFPLTAKIQYQLSWNEQTIPKWKPFFFIIIS